MIVEIIINRKKLSFGQVSVIGLALMNFNLYLDEMNDQLGYDDNYKQIIDDIFKIWNTMECNNDG